MTVYDYFASNFGTINKWMNSVLENKYRPYSVKTLKQKLRALKYDSSQANIEEIRYVSGLIRKKITKTTWQDMAYSVQKGLNKNFWTTCNKIFTTALAAVPTFDINSCFNYFKNTLSCHAQEYSFVSPSWMPQFPVPCSAYSSQPPTYSQIAGVINRCSARSSACPYDQLSIILLKRCVSHITNSVT